LIADYCSWFRDQWESATVWETIRTRYIARYEESDRKDLILVEDEDDEVNALTSIRWITAERLRRIRTARNLWIDVGRTHNRGKGKPGEQL